MDKFWLKANYLAGFVVILLIAWAAWAEVHTAVHGTGRTVSAGENKQIQHLEGGIIADILVQEGQKVSTGQPLFRIRNENNTATLEENKLKLQSLENRRIPPASRGRKQKARISDRSRHRAIIIR